MERIVLCLSTSILTHHIHCSKEKKAHSVKRWVTYCLVCSYYPTSKKTRERKFEGGKMQQKGTNYQNEHGSNTSSGRLLSTTNYKVSTKTSTEKEKMCLFSMQIFCCKATHKWFIGYDKSRTASSIVHCNHLPLDPQHMVTKQNDLTEVAKATIGNLVSSGATNASIINYVQIHFNIVISSNQIRKYKLQQMDDIIGNFGDTNPSPTAVDKLIKLMQSMTNVSYIIVKHNHDTGLVTYQKAREKPNETKSIMRSDDPTASSLIEEVKSWRSTLSISGSNEILVSLAWSHEEECRKIQMFPEFLAGDMTFGLNRQKRNLYVITGIDGHNKIFTGFRCWMPSKQKAAYTWVLKIAFPQLVGIHTTSRIHCLASDDEPAMVDAINDAINSPDSSSMSKVKHRLDYDHFLPTNLLPFLLSTNSTSTATVTHLLLFH